MLKAQSDPQTCPVKCLPNEMFTPLNAELIHLGHSLFHRGFAETSAADLTGVSQIKLKLKAECSGSKEFNCFAL
jgi:hypothetical protein